jgi:hypothetical protein
VVETAPSRGRLWSLAKPISAIAAYQLAMAGGRSPSASLVTAARDAITRSDNCGERRVILEIEKQAGGIRAARVAFHRVLAEAGVHLTTTIRRSPLKEDPECVAYLSKRAGPLRNTDVWQFGTSEWTTWQAVAFAHALADGTYGRAGVSILNLMKLHKQPELSSLEGPTGEQIKDLQWGAGRALSAWAPAYKAGWGGARRGRFLASQVVVLKTRPAAALAVVFYPSVQPRTDNLGETVAPRAISRLFAVVSAELRRGRY